MLIIGPNQSGKKSLAQRIAQMAGMERLVTVYNPRDSDALAKAKGIVRGYKRKKVMLLLPRIDLAYQLGDPELLAELDALIETTSERPNVLVVATTVEFAADSDLDNMFGIKLALPGAGLNPADRPEIPAEAGRMLSDVAHFYLAEAQRRGFQLAGMTEDEFRSRILECVVNPAEIEDIVVLCQTTAIYRKRTRQTAGAIFTREVLETAIARVVARALDSSTPVVPDGAFDGRLYAWPIMAGLGGDFVWQKFDCKKASPLRAPCVASSAKFRRKTSLRKSSVIPTI